VHGRGYRWVAAVDVDTDPPATTREAAGAGSAAPLLEQKIHFCRTPDGARLAYATVGDGPPLVRAAHWVTHLDYEWEGPVWRHWMEGLSRSRMLVRYDERGCGLSEADPEDISFEAFVRDLETVVDELGLERFPLMGLSQGGPVAIEYAVRHPERVSRLVLVGAFRQGRIVRARTEEENAEACSATSSGWVGGATTRRSGSTSRRRSCPTRRPSCGATSPSSCGAPPRPRTP
jgi:pimeloyl-ACP methyl ester carboxylesterase